MLSVDDKMELLKNAEKRVLRKLDLLFCTVKNLEKCEKEKQEELKEREIELKNLISRVDNLVDRLIYIEKEVESLKERSHVHKVVM